MAVHVHAENWPLVLVDMQSPSNEEYARYFERVDEFLLRRQPFALVINTLDSGGTTGQEGRRAQAEYMHRQADALSRYLVGIGMVIRSSAVRAVVTSIMWMQPPPSPVAVFRTEEEATRWARNQLRESGIVPPVLRTDLRKAADSASF